MTFQLNLSEMSNFCSCGYSVSYSFILEPVRKYLNGFSYNCLGEFTIYDCVLEAKDFTCSVRKEREGDRVGVFLPSTLSLDQKRSTENTN